MRVTKRTGQLQPVNIAKIQHRIQRLCEGLGHVDSALVSQKVVSGLYDQVPTTQLDTLAAETSASLIPKHYEYDTLAARLAVSNLHAQTNPDLLETLQLLGNLIDPEVLDMIARHRDTIQGALCFDNDFGYDYFGFKTLCKSYLLRVNGAIVERPQHMLMRVALGIHGQDLDSALNTYHMMSNRIFTHASPTLFNAGTRKPQMSSCFLLDMTEDSIDGIYETLARCAKISKGAGGIGVHVHRIRAAGTPIEGTNGVSNGLPPMLRVYNATARYVDQCFAPETIVYTHRGPTPMGSLVKGDTILTAAGTMETIDQVLEYQFTGKILKIVSKQSYEPIRVTGEHQVLALRGQAKGVNFDVIHNRLSKGYAKPEMTDAKDLIPGDFVCYPIPATGIEQDDNSITVDDMHFYGLMVGDGWITSAPNGSDGICTSTFDKDADYRAFVTKYLQEHNVHFSIGEDTEKHTIRYVWSTNAPGFKFSRSDLYDASGTKIIHAKFLNLPKEKAMGIVHGVLQSDGCIYKEICLEMTSKPVIDAVRYILMRFGILSSGYCRDRIGNVSSYKNITTRKKTYVLRIPLVRDITAMFPTASQGKYTTYLVHEGMMYSRIVSIEEEDFEGKVYDLEVANEHTYITSALGSVHNGGGKRKGAFAVYLEPWHADIFEVLELKHNTGSDEIRARDLFYALWIPDLFYERVDQNGMWSLMCPKECPGLAECYGADFNALYTRYEAEGKFKRQVRAQELFMTIIATQIESGGPYMLNKDQCNLKNNQSNLGTLRGSNLCVAPYTRILTKDGYVPIGSLKDKQVTIWNGFEWSDVTVRQTGHDKELLRVTCSNGSVLDCTPEHIFYTQDQSDGEPFKVSAKDLKVGDYLCWYLLPENLKEAQSPSITSIDKVEGLHDTYCFTEPKRGRGTFEGIVTGQCAEILEYTSPDEVAVCNLASISLKAHLKSDGTGFDHDALIRTVRQIVINLNRIIDRNFYPVPQARHSNLKHRPMGIGVQGLHDVFYLLRMPFDSPEARALNRDIFETIYYAACRTSCELAQTEGVYESYHGSPMSQGKFQFDLWGVEPQLHDWQPLRDMVAKHGMRNSLLVALMPTASTSQILGNVECFEASTSNLYARSTLAGTFQVVNRYLVNDLMARNLWDEDMKRAILAHEGSVQNIDRIPQDLKDLYKTVYEIKQRVVMDLAADRAPYVDQTQSMNLHVINPTVKKIANMHLYAWKLKLKTCQYYLRTLAAAEPVKFTIAPNQMKQSFGAMNYQAPVCEIGCDSCGS